MNGRHVEPDDALSVVELVVGGVVKVCWVMRLEMAVDDGVRMKRNVRLMCMQGCQA